MIDSFFEGPSLMNAAVALERDGMVIRAQLAECQILLAQRTETAKRGKELVQTQANEIKALKAQIAEFATPKEPKP